MDGAPEAIDDTETGKLYDVGDVDGLAEGIVDILGNDTLRRRMGQRGFERVGLFSREKMVQDLDRLYEDLMHQIE